MNKKLSTGIHTYLNEIWIKIVIYAIKITISKIQNPNECKRLLKIYPN